MDKNISIFILLLLSIFNSSTIQAQEIDSLATQILIPTYDNQFLVGVKYYENSKRFKIKGTYDKSGKKLEGLFAGFVNPIAAECQDLKKLSVATDTRSVWNIEKDLLENSESTTILCQTDSGNVIQCGNTYSEFPAAGFWKTNDTEIKQVYIRFYLVEGSLKTYIILKENDNSIEEVSVLTVKGHKLVLKEGDKPREIPQYKIKSGETHYVKAVRDTNGILQVMSNYFGEFQLVPFTKDNLLSLDEFIKSR